MFTFISPVTDTRGPTLSDVATTLDTFNSTASVTVGAYPASITQTLNTLRPKIDTTIECNIFTDAMKTTKFGWAVVTLAAGDITATVIQWCCVGVLSQGQGCCI